MAQLLQSGTDYSKTLGVHNLLASHLNYNTQPKCLNSSLLCNGNHDCPHGDDEWSCEQISCPQGHLHCLNHHNVLSCVEDSWLCDGKKDCIDETDESNCDGKSKDDNNYGKCEENEFDCGGDYCLSKDFVCDGFFDCPGILPTDEFNCTCNNVTLYCDGIYWIPLHAACTTPSFSTNMKMLCPKSVRQLTCEEDEFRCHDGSHCIMKKYRCDYYIDCRDFSDEAFCPKEATSLLECNNVTEINCGDEVVKCVKHSDVCTKENCGDMCLKDVSKSRHS